MRFLLFLILLIWCSRTGAQNLVQNIRGNITDKDSKTPLPGASVILLGAEPLKGTVTDLNGHFRLEQVPLGRHALKVTYLGYKDAIINDIILNSAKEVVLNIELDENVIEGAEVVITAEQQKDKPLNEMATVSARSFTIEETNKYAGSWGDPSRMVANFAGVTQANDQRNDIVVRGNSPLGVLWRLEGMEIPNPNHFSTNGASGGAISILNNNTLDNSDFLTGAFPAEYGNAISGVFDLRMRKGNNEKREYLAQVGAAGFELGAEGPFVKGKRSSYLISYRYSAFGLMASLGFFDFVGTVPYYQDLTFKTFFPYKKGNFEVFGIGGKSYLTFEPAEDTTAWKDDRYLMRKRRPDSGMGTAGMSWMHFIGDKTHLKWGAVAAVSNSTYFEDSTDYGYNWHRLFYTNFTEGRYGTTFYINSKLDARNTIKAGLAANYLFFDFVTERHVYWPIDTNLSIIDFDGNSVLIQGFVQWKLKLAENLSLNSGAHLMHYTLNGKTSPEPRAGLRWDFTDRQALSLGFGMHTKLLPAGVYFSQMYNPDGTFSRPNQGLDFVHATHYVIGYDLLPYPNIRLKLEAYYQSISDAPVLRDSASYFSGLNTGADYENISATKYLASKGTGHNTGAELTLEKFYSAGYYFLMTGSLYDSRYTGSDGIERNTAFNANYAYNLLAGKEFKVGKTKNNLLSFSFTWVTVGGNRVVPVDLVASRYYDRQVLDYSRAFEEREKDYMRLDGRITFRKNRKKFSDEIALDIRNLLNRKNIFNSYYNEHTGDISYEYQVGFFPVLFYKVEF